MTECGGGIAAVAVDGDDSQIRSYPASTAARSPGRVRALRGPRPARPRARPGGGGRRAARGAGLPERARTLILAGEQLALQIHESIGHAVELDRVLGRETSYAGGSFARRRGRLAAVRLRPRERDRRRLHPGALGTYRWDDEGVAAQALPIVRDGMLAGFLSSRESAAEIGLARSGGCARADGFARQPIVRMTNVSLEPGEAGTLEDLIADTDDGMLMETNRSWSIDDRRLHFQFDGEAAWEIRGGELRRLLRNPSYAGVTPRFWGRLRRDVLGTALARHVAARLRQGRARPVRARVARDGAGALPRRRGGRCLTCSSWPSERWGTRAAGTPSSRSCASARSRCASPPTGRPRPPWSTT